MSNNRGLILVGNTIFGGYTREEIDHYYDLLYETGIYSDPVIRNLNNCINLSK